MRPAVFKLSLRLPDCECATAFHNGGHCLFGGESVGFFIYFFVSIISRSLMFDMAGDQRFLWLEAGLFSVPVPLSTGIGAPNVARPPP